MCIVFGFVLICELAADRVVPKEEEKRVGGGDRWVSEEVQ